MAIKRDNAKLKQELDAATGALRAKEDEVRAAAEQSVDPSEVYGV